MARPRTTSCLLCVLLFTAHLNAQPTQPTTLPAAVAELGRENSYTLSQLSRFTAEVDEVVDLWKWDQHAQFETLISVRADRARVREDDRPVHGDATQPSSISKEIRKGEVHTVSGRSLSKQIRSAQEVITFLADTPPTVTVVAGDANSPFGDSTSPIHAYLAVQGKPLERTVSDLALKGYFPTVSIDQIDGVEYTLLEWNFPQAKMGQKLWIARDFGCLVKRMQQSYQGQVMREWTVNLSKFGDTFAFDAVDDATWLHGKPTRKTRYTIKSFTVNPSFDEDTFSVTSLGIPEGTLVQDRIANTQYRFGAPTTSTVNSIPGAATAVDLPDAAQHEASSQPADTTTSPESHNGFLLISGGAAAGTVLLAYLLTRWRKASGTTHR